MKINKKYILAITLLGCSSSGLAKGPAADFSISWTGETTNDVSVIKEEGQNVGKNHNEMLSHQDWGVANRNNDDKGPVETYEESDPDLMIHKLKGSVTFDSHSHLISIRAYNLS